MTSPFEVTDPWQKVEFVIEIANVSKHNFDAFTLDVESFPKHHPKLCISLSEEEWESCPHKRLRSRKYYFGEQREANS